MAQSITTTLGLSSLARRTASVPSAASPVTSISGSSSRMRRNPRRTRLWSSTSKTEILSGMRLLLLSQFFSELFSRDRQPNQCTAGLGTNKFNGPAQQLRSFPHCYEPNSLFHGLHCESAAVIFHL